MATQRRTFIAVTGAQGVGKSTFCLHLKGRLEGRGLRVSLLAGLGATLKAQGFVMGDKADDRAVAAVVREHLVREREAPEGVVVLDRCLVDMLAYVRTLGITPRPLSDVYEEVVKAMAPRLQLVVFLEMSDAFKISRATHEDALFRERIDREIKAVLTELALPVQALDAAGAEALERAVMAIVSLQTIHVPETP